MKFKNEQTFFLLILVLFLSGCSSEPDNIMFLGGSSGILGGGNTTINNNYYNITQNITNDITNNNSFYINTTNNITIVNNFTNNITNQVGGWTNTTTTTSTNLNVTTSGNVTAYSFSGFLDYSYLLNAPTIVNYQTQINSVKENITEANSTARAALQYRANITALNTSKANLLNPTFTGRINAQNITITQAGYIQVGNRSVGTAIACNSANFGMIYANWTTKKLQWCNTTD